MVSPTPALRLAMAASLLLALAQAPTATASEEDCCVNYCEEPTYDYQKCCELQPNRLECQVPDSDEPCRSGDQSCCSRETDPHCAWCATNPGDPFCKDCTYTPEGCGGDPNPVKQCVDLLPCFEILCQPEDPWCVGESSPEDEGGASAPSGA